MMIGPLRLLFSVAAAFRAGLNTYIFFAYIPVQELVPEPHTTRDSLKDLRFFPSTSFALPLYSSFVFIELRPLLGFCVIG